MKRLTVQVKKMRTVWIKHRLVLILVCVLILAWISFSTLTLQLNQKASYNIIKLEQIKAPDSDVEVPVQKRNVVVKEEQTYSKTVVQNIQHIAKFIHNAKKHVRGSKTSDFLKQALESMDSVLVELGLNPETLYSRPVSKTENVCPEKYMGTTYGYPFFYKGFETTNCTHEVPIWKLVTIIQHIVITEKDSDSCVKKIGKFLSSVYKTNPNFNVILSVNNINAIEKIKVNYPLISLIESKDVTEGTALNQMVDKVTTPYVFIARNSQLLTNDSRLERLIREIETIGVKVAGSAIRDSDGHWIKGCFQTMYRNYTLKYLEGYDESLHECLFCDYIQGPFVSSKAFLQNQQFLDLNTTEGLFEEWFLRISQKSEESITCPDSMFHVKSLYTDQYGELRLFMRKWNLFKVVTPNGAIRKRSCANEGTSKPGSKTLSPCSAQFNADAVKNVLKTCEEAGLICELQEGTALGAVKLGKTLPWERDADIAFLTAHYSGFQKLKDTLKKLGLGFSDLGATWCCADNRTAGGKFMLSYKGWNLELYGQHIMDSELLISEGMKPSKVLLDGQWVNVPRNPGLFVRNRYGREIYQHAEHWMTTGGSSGWINYKTKVFKKCSNPGDHDCLDRYNADGDLPFVEMLP